MKEKSIASFFAPKANAKGSGKGADAKAVEAKPSKEPSAEAHNDEDASGAGPQKRRRLKRAVLDSDDEEQAGTDKKASAAELEDADAPAAKKVAAEAPPASATEPEAAKAPAPDAAPSSSPATKKPAATEEEKKAFMARFGKPAAASPGGAKKGAAGKQQQQRKAEAGAKGKPATGAGTQEKAAEKAATAAPASMEVDEAPAAPSTSTPAPASGSKPGEAPAHPIFGSGRGAAGGKQAKAGSAAGAGSKSASKSDAGAKEGKEGAEGAAGTLGRAEEAAGAGKGDGGDDDISGSDFDEEEEVAAAAARGGGKKAAGAKKKAGTKGNSNVEGVGAGAIAAALLHSKVNLQDDVIKGRWKAGDPVPYELMAETFEAISATTKRLEITHLLISCFRGILATTPEDLLPAVCMCVNRVAPAHMGVELGVGESTIIKALAEACGRKEQFIKSEFESLGDLGQVAVACRATQRTMFQPKPLTIRSVFKAFKEIALTSGEKSAERKKGSIVKLLVSSKGIESGYIVRSLGAKLRIGLAEQSVLVALAHAYLLHSEGAKKGDNGLADRLETASQQVKHAYSECPSYDVLVPAMREHGLERLHDHCHFMPGVPVKPMLAKATNGVGEVIEKFQDIEFTCEYKYDGERAQIHYQEDGTVLIFSRNSENMTGKYPDLVARFKTWLKPGVKSLVVDSEAVAYDMATKRILPFQVLSTRARKDVAVADIKVAVVVFAFDCLYMNGETLLQRPLTERRKALYDSMQETEDQFRFATHKISKDVEELAAFLNESVEGCTEGLIVKTMDDTYEPSKRSSHWLKLKKDYMDGVGDTFDVVPIGAFFGKGKRTGVFGAYLLAIYDPDSETYQTISKLGTGFTEKELEELDAALRPHIIPKPRPYYRFHTNSEPDVWFDAVKVWEVKCADISISPVHKAADGLVQEGKGISIRFPRLIRVRDDKGPEDSTSAQQVADMYRMQASTKHQNTAAVDEDEV